MDIGANALIAKLTMFKMAMLSEAVVAVDNTCRDVAVYAKITHGIQGGNPNQPGKNIFRNRTYNLETSIHSDVPKINGTSVCANVLATMPYAGDVEFGTSTSSPYPYLKPSVEARAHMLSIELELALIRAKGVLR